MRQDLFLYTTNLFKVEIRLELGYVDSQYYDTRMYIKLEPILTMYKIVWNIYCWQIRTNLYGSLEIHIPGTGMYFYLYFFFYEPPN